MSKKNTFLKVLAVVLVVVVLAVGGLMLYRVGFAQGVAGGSFPGGVERFSRSSSQFGTPEGGRIMSGRGIGFSPLALLGAGLFHLLGFLLIVGLFVGLIRWAVWGGRRGHFAHSAGRHFQDSKTGWYSGPVPSWMHMQEQPNSVADVKPETDAVNETPE